MGGLVARSAIHYSTGPNQKSWLPHLEHLVTLGTPHHGAVLERGGKLVDLVLGAHRYTEPISWLGKIRSGGVTDLGYGNVTEQDWKDIPPNSIGDFRRPTPLPREVRTLAIAAVLGDNAMESSSMHRFIANSVRTDGLVSEGSALGKGHVFPDMNLQFEECRTFYNLNHVGMLSDERVYEAIRSFVTARH